MGVGMSKQRKRPSVIGRSWPWIIAAVVAVFWVFGRISGGFAFGLKAGVNLREFLIEMAMVLPPMFLLVGLFDVWVPRHLVERHAGRQAGAAAIPWMVLLATLQAGPLYAAFPFAIGLWRKGCAPRNVFIYLFAFSAMKLPMLTFEVAFLGWRFSLARTIITLLVFIPAGMAMERLLPEAYSPPEAAY